MNTDGHLDIGALIFPDIDQLDFTGPFEVFSRLPNSSFHILWKDKIPDRRSVAGLYTKFPSVIGHQPPFGRGGADGGSGHRI